MKKIAVLVFLAATVIAIRELIFHVQLIAPPPTTPDEFTQRPATAESMAIVPITVPLHSLARKLNEVVPPSLSEEKDDPTDLLTEDKAKISLNRGEVVCTIEKGRLKIVLPIVDGEASISGRFGAKKKNKGLLGALEDVASVDTSGSVKNINGKIIMWMMPTLTPDWSVVPNIDVVVDVTNADIELKDIGKVASVRGVIEEKIKNKQGELIAKMNALLADSKLLRDPANEYWKKGFIVRRLHESESAWLVITPARVIAQPVNFDKDAITLSVGIAAKSDIVHQATAPDNPPSEMPPLDVTGGAANGLKIQLPVAVNYALLNNAIGRRIEEIKLESDEYSVTFESIEIGALGDRLLATVVATGKPNWWDRTTATIRVVGRPYLDVRRKQLSVVDLDFDANSKNLLASSAAWLLKPIILQELKNALVVDTEDVEEDVIRDANLRIGEYIKQAPREIALDANLASLAISDLRVTPDALYIVVTATGAVKIIARELVL